MDTINLGLKIEQKSNEMEKWDIVCFIQCNNADDSVVRRIISRFVLYVLDATVYWRVKAWRSMVLSNSEAEWVAFQWI